MRITPTGEDFATIHHELGHLYYDLAYRTQSYLFKNGANDGFHESIGDAVALSITPDYLMKVSLMAQASDPAQDLGPMMHRALEKVAFLPFAFLVDQWRWKIYAASSLDLTSCLTRNAASDSSIFHL